MDQNTQPQELLQSNQPIMPEPGQMPRKTWTPKFIGLILGLLILGGVAYAGLWFWNDKNKEAVVPTFTPRITDKTASWKTYNNNQYGFEFKYPDDWNYSKEEYPKNHNILCFGEKGNQYKVELRNFEVCAVSLHIYRSNQNTVEPMIVRGNTLKEWDPSVKVINFDVDGSSAIKIQGYNNADEIFIYKNGVSLNIISEYKYAGNNISQTLDKILPTFKFINEKSSQDTGILKGKVSIGPICPVERTDHPCTPAPEAYTSRQVMIYKSDGATLVATQNFDTQGNYNIALSLGTYVVKSKTGIGSTASVVGEVTIKNGQTTTLDFSIDTGIR